MLLPVPAAVLAELEARQIAVESAEPTKIVATLKPEATITIRRIGYPGVDTPSP